MTINPDENPVLIVDALNVFMRHFVANPTMSSLGHHAGGVVGFLKNLQLLSDRLCPSRIIVVWEGGGSTRRRSIYKDYKAKRKPQKLNRFYADDIPDTVKNKNDQVSILVSMLRYVPVSQVYVSDCEADDVISYIVKNVIKDSRCVIVSSDKDYYQLLSDNITQWSPGQKKFITKDDVAEKFGISVTNFCTARAIIGDDSDNLPGIKGAGFRTLAKRFPSLAGDEFISVDEIIKLSAELTASSKVKLYQRIVSGDSVVRRNWKLMYLGTQNMSSSQVQKIEYLIDTFEPSQNKIGLMKRIVEEGLTTFDVDSFYMSMKSALRR